MGRARYRVTAAFALILFLFLQTPIGRASFIAEPDRAMLDLSYYWRRNEVRADAPPVLYVRIDDWSIAEYWRARDGRALFPIAADTSAGVAITETPLGTPRGMLADLLRFARASDGEARAQTVILDVDVAWATGDEAGEQRLAEELRAWAADPDAPFLVLARETVPAAPERNAGRAALAAHARPLVQLPPAPRYDDIVRLSPNIAYAIVSFQVDPRGVVREYNQAVCAVTPNGLGLVPSAVWAVVAATETANAAAAKVGLAAALEANSAHCASFAPLWAPPSAAVNYHLAVGPGYDAEEAGQARLAAVPVRDGWAWRSVCGVGRPSASWSPADELLTASARATEASIADLLCGSILVIGGNTSLQPDAYWSPYGRMDGAMVLSNAVRGRLVTGNTSEPWRRNLHLVFQIGMVLLTVLLVRIVFQYVGHVRRNLNRSRGSRSGLSNFIWGVGIVAVHPVTLNWLAPIVLFVFGAIVTVLTLNFGFWGMVTFPAFAASLAECIFEWEADLAAEGET